MCGIAGSFDRSGEDVKDPWVVRALERVRHRGPDATGVNAWGPATHGHVRLSILDLDERSNQPFVYGGVLLSYVGECWNHRELRDSLLEEGYEFSTDGDTEVVAAWLSWALHQDWTLSEAVGKMEWQGALAVTESVSGRTWLARDPLGETPLYVLEDEEQGSIFSGAGRIRWASERRAFDDRQAEARPVPAGAVWQLSDVPDFYYEMPHRLERGADPDPEMILNYVDRAVEERLIADVPVCFLASGGLDSSLILALVAQRRPDVVAYRARLRGATSEDWDMAARVCDHLGVELRDVEIDLTPGSTRHAIQVIEIAMKAQVEIAQLCLPLAERISEDGFRVVLSGEGADELFGGYGNLMRKSTNDRLWNVARRAALEKQARGNCVRTNKCFMAHGVEARLPFLDRQLIDLVLPLGTAACPPGKGLLKDAARPLLPPDVIDQRKRTFQGASGLQEQAEHAYEGRNVKEYNAIARSLFGGLPRG